MFALKRFILLFLLNTKTKTYYNILKSLLSNVRHVQSSWNGVL